MALLSDQYAQSVAVIIPTCNRPQLLIRALKTVTEQTLPAREVFVILDGPSPETREMLSNSGVPNLTILGLATRSGVCAVRNYGIAHAKSKWIALLDDDDEWLPQKLEKQVRAAQKSFWPHPVVFSRVVVRTPAQESVFPRRGPDPGETIPHYLFCRKTLLPWEVLMQSSNLFTSRALLERVPFTNGLGKWDDTDWLMRASQVQGAGLDFLDEPLSIWYLGETRETLSSTLNWQYLFEWTKRNRHLFPKSAYSGALLRDIAREAMKQKAKGAGWPLLREAVKNGHPDLIQLLSFMIAVGLTWFLPQRLDSSVARAGMRKGFFWDGE
jgi:glycosyltransferase involved in cell wall biosynthesis